MSQLNRAHECKGRFGKDRDITLSERFIYCVKPKKYRSHEIGHAINSISPFIFIFV